MYLPLNSYIKINIVINFFLFQTHENILSYEFMIYLYYNTKVPAAQ